MTNRSRRCSEENIDTSRTCVKWSPEEEAKLVESIINNKTFEEIALEHKRTIIAVKARLYRYKILFNRNILRAITESHISPLPDITADT
jgi:hypothetical protein